MVVKWYLSSGEINPVILKVSGCLNKEVSFWQTSTLTHQGTEYCQ